MRIDLQSLSLPPPYPSPIQNAATHFSKLSFLSIHKPQKTHLFSLHSIDVSKEDKTPTLSDPTRPNPPTESPPEEEEEPEFDKRRLEAKFAVLNTGIYECRSCGYKYDEAVGDPSYPIPPGFQFDKLPDDGRCSTCGAAKISF
ncbi:hypothetical protein OIU84_017907 [Salix udensis]|uniref:Rubredoxin-like domain-containing protein n=1 Tax=Salix udensis TaxID=889485 RepID=A0AAD6L464_9ROSI|nr:hypothetical protein OIU84_017907 [Salix udensis]